ncbi:unnamed protein product [Brassica rapa]|uniref:Uncharacterized protein n=1 Tax=Brassica campestris TaxID=3711 RepID=A0A3P6ADF1_BRACM|nr:unnamed protein product [Brassica rapa]VDC85484.1 unnamed protein product [Brassica rapa]
MSQDHDETENKSYADAVGGDGDDAGETVKGETTNGDRKTDSVKVDEEDGSESLYSLVCITIGSILFPDSKTGYASSSPLLQRIRNSFAENGPKLREASKKTSREILQWTRRGSYLRALLVITMGTIGLVTTMALVVFALFFVAATFNAIIISLLVSLAAAGGFLALFFLSLAGIYIGALSVAAFVVSTVTISAVVSVWIGFFYAVWLGARGSLGLVKQSLSVMGGNTFSRHQHKYREVNIESSS